MQNPLSIFTSIMAKKDRSLKKQDRTALEKPQTAEVAWLSNQWQEHPVVGMTPLRMHRLLTDAEQGNLQAHKNAFLALWASAWVIYAEIVFKR